MVQDTGTKHSHRKPGGWSFAEWSYYAIWLVFLVAEGVITRVLLWLAHLMAPPAYGLWIAMGVFFAGLTLLSLVFYKVTKHGATLHGPFLRWTSAWLRWPGGWKYLGFVLSTLLAATTGLAEVLKAERYRYSMTLIVVSAAVFSVAWVPVFVYGF